MTKDLQGLRAHREHKRCKRDRVFAKVTEGMDLWWCNVKLSWENMVKRGRKFQ